MKGGIWEIILIVLLVLILFHAKIPVMARNIANGIKTFKKEVKEEPAKKKVSKKKK